MRHADGTLHFSDLKAFHHSPAHYLESVTRERQTTRHMRIGSLTDMALLTSSKPVVWDGERKGNAWKCFEEDHHGADVYTKSEYDDAMLIVEAVRRDPIARDLLGLDDAARRTQVPLAWKTNGVERSTRGIDVLTKNRLVDFKTTNSTKPGLFVWQAQRMFWHAQMADYEEACRQNGIDISGGTYLLGVESSAPYCVTALKLAPSATLAGTKLIASWIEKFKACELAGEWPGYVQVPWDFEIEEAPELYGLDDDEAAEDAA